MVEKSYKAGTPNLDSTLIAVGMASGKITYKSAFGLAFFTGEFATGDKKRDVIVPSDGEDALPQSQLE